jgi:hypothetical protein
VGFPATAWLANFHRRFATVSTEQLCMKEF